MEILLLVDYCTIDYGLLWHFPACVDSCCSYNKSYQLMSTHVDSCKPMLLSHRLVSHSYQLVFSVLYEINLSSLACLWIALIFQILWCCHNLPMDAYKRHTNTPIRNSYMQVILDLRWSVSKVALAVKTWNCTKRMLSNGNFFGKYWHVNIFLRVCFHLLQKTSVL